MNTLPKFLTAYGSDRKGLTTPCGHEEETTYEYKTHKDGSKELIESGKTNVYAKIQEQLEDTKIENILKRASAGDNTVFRPDGIYEDTTQFPKTIHEQIALANSIPDLEQELTNLSDKMDSLKKGDEKNEQEHGTTLQGNAEIEHKTE